MAVLSRSAGKYPVSILHKSIADRYRPVRVADGPITALYRFIKNASWVPCSIQSVYHKTCASGRENDILNKIL